ncbi:MAG: hypothetical protein DHS20C15_12450 [Planctomycetota bacterium]|nr:MAG: hypothetical protein DHS20C15_12450 [Planctomycetota bacterium]
MTSVPDTASFPASRRSRCTWLALAFVLFVAGWQGATARPTHPWSGIDDFTAYLLHGHNLLEGRPYADLGDLSDPELPDANLREAFPPVYPWVLAQVERLVPALEGAEAPPLGVNVLAFKRVQAVIFAAQLLLLFFVFRRLMGDKLALALLVVLGTNAFLFQFREFVRSESLFGLVVAGLFLVMAKLDEQPSDAARRWVLAIVAGLLGWVVYGTRTAGMVVPLAVLAHELWTRRRVRKPVCLVLALTLAGMLLQKLMFASVVGGYLDHAKARLGPATVLENVRHFQWELERILAEGLPDGLRSVVVMIFGALAAYGLLSRLRKPSLPEVFAAGTLAMHLLLPTDSAWLRYLIPLLPVFVFLVLVGARALGQRLLGAGDAVALVTAGLFVALTVPGHLAQPSGPLPDGPGTPDAREALAWIRERSAPSHVVGFRKPWALSLATGRPAHLYGLDHLHAELSVSEQLAHLERMRTRWLLLRHRERRDVLPFKILDYDDREVLASVIEPHPERFAERARNSEFVLYEVLEPTR